MLNIYKIVENKIRSRSLCETSGVNILSLWKSVKELLWWKLSRGHVSEEKQKDGYRVTKTRYAEDGESLERSIWKLCKGYPDVAIRMMKDSVTQNQRKKVLQKYVSQNKLKIKAYKEYGWQYVNL